MRLIKSTAIIGSMTMLSRILGLVRDILWAKYLGAGAINDALLTATKLPNLFRRMFAEGAFNAAFVPMYARRLEGEGKETAANFAGEALSALTLIVLLIIIAFQLTMPWTLNLIGGGLDKVAGADGLVPYDLAVLYARITMPYLLLMSLAALFSGMLNTRNYFAMAAFVPAMLNMVWIGVLMWPGAADIPRETLALYLAIFMLVSGVLQAGGVLFALKKAKIRLPLKRPRYTKNMKRLVELGLPGLIAAGITHINLMISHAIATFKLGAASWLYYADRLYQLPLGIIGIAMGVALLPRLSRDVRSPEKGASQASLNKALEIAALLTIPAAFALATMPQFLIGGLFERGAFDSTATVQSAKALRAFAIGLPAFVLIKVLTPAFFAREDTRTPMVFAGLSALINVTLGAALFFTIGFFGLALATSIAAWVNVIGLSARLLQNGYFTPNRALASRMVRITLASGIMTAALIWVRQTFGMGHGGALVSDFIRLTLVCGFGGAVYLAAAFALRAFSLTEIKDITRRC